MMGGPHLALLLICFLKSESQVSSAWTVWETCRVMEIRSTKAAGIALTIAGALTFFGGLILATTYIFPEIEQVSGDFVLISQNRWTLPALIGGAAMAVLGLLMIFGRRPRWRADLGEPVHREEGRERVPPQAPPLSAQRAPREQDRDRGRGGPHFGRHARRVRSTRRHGRAGEAGHEGLHDLDDRGPRG